jgi:hypothetical protein
MVIRTLSRTMYALVWLAMPTVAGVVSARAQEPGIAEVRVRLTPVSKTVHPETHQLPSPPAVIWLTPLGGRVYPFPAQGHYTLLQKNRMFKPHLLIVPVGAVVEFPNADSYFHNVFSLFDGKRFDLGLYEAGTTREVVFSREGLSYIFCNIHPQMSSVVISLSTPFYSIADAQGLFDIIGVPSGDYELHVWLEGEPQASLDTLTRKVHVEAGKTDLGMLPLSATPRPPATHDNMFGQPYPPNSKRPY